MYELVIYDDQGGSTSYQMSNTAREILMRNDIIEQGEIGHAYYVLHPGLSEPWRTIVKALLDLENDDED